METEDLSPVEKRRRDRKQKPKPERYAARTELFTKPGRILKLRLSKAKRHGGVFVITSRLSKDDGGTLKGKPLEFRTEAEAVEQLEKHIGMASMKGWSRKESRSRFDFEGIPE